MARFNKISSFVNAGGNPLDPTTIYSAGSGNSAIAVTRSLTGGSGHAFSAQDTFYCVGGNSCNSYDSITWVYGLYAGSIANTHTVCFQGRNSLRGGLLPLWYGLETLPEVKNGALVTNMYGAFIGAPTITNGTLVSGVAWSASSSVATITSPAHGLGVGCYVTISSSSNTGVVANALVQIATVPNANSFTVACSAGTASGTLSYTPRSTVLTNTGIYIGDMSAGGSGVSNAYAFRSEYSAPSWHVGSWSFGYSNVAPSDTQVYITPVANNVSGLKIASHTSTTGAYPILNLAGTWNGAVVHTGILLTITNTSSNAGSKFIDCKIGLNTAWCVSKEGLTGYGGAAPTIASAATIAPTAPVTFISGTTTINTITPPAPIATQGGSIVLIPTGLWSTGTSGNIAIATTGVVSKALHLTYDPTTTKWYPSY